MADPAATSASYEKYIEKRDALEAELLPKFKEYACGVWVVVRCLCLCVFACVRVYVLCVCVCVFVFVCVRVCLC
jgi:hypothetical protein